MSRVITTDQARRIVTLSEALDAFPELARASQRNTPKRPVDGDRVVIIVQVAAVCESGAEPYGEVELDMVSGRLLLPAVRQVITGELKKLRAKA